MSLTWPVTLPVKSPTTLPATSPVTLPVKLPVTSPVTSPVRSPVTLPVTSPVTSPVRLPVTLPVTSPVTSPVRLPVTLPVRSPVTLPVTLPTKLPATLPVTSPVKSPVTLPVRLPVIPPVELNVVNVPAPATDPPITTPSSAPPVIATLFASCTAIVPSPKFVRAPAAVLAPVPPLEMPTIPLTKLVLPRSNVPAVATPFVKLITPVPVLKSPPKPPYWVPITVPFHEPATTLPTRMLSRVEPSDAVRSKREFELSYFKRPPLLPI